MRRRHVVWTSFVQRARLAGAMANKSNEEKPKSRGGGAHLCVAPVSPSTSVARGARSTNTSLVLLAVTLSPYLAAMASRDHGLSASSISDGVLKLRSVVDSSPGVP